MSKPVSKNTRPRPDDDTDDLDDVLGGFAGDKSSKPKASGPSAPSTPGPSGSRPAAPPNTSAKKSALGDLDVGDDFARELAEGMAALMREIAAEGAATGAGGAEDDVRREAAFRKAWEDMIVDGMNGALDTEDFDKTKGKTPAKPGEASKAQVGDDAFQANLRSAMDKLKVSEDVAKENEAEPTDDENDAFEKLLAALGENGGGESEEELQRMLETMMSQLMSKDVLYEPLKELHEKFPGYLKDNAGKLSAADKQRYEAQQSIVSEIITVFEDPTYTPEDQEKGIRIVTLMNTMQTHGSPPPEIMGPLPPGLELGTDGLPKLPEGCSIQ